jgi:glycerol kinase
MRLIIDSADSEYYADTVSDTGGVYLVPAFTGLGAPYWDMYARGCIIGLTRGTKRAHIIRAAQESIAYQVMDLLRAMEKDIGVTMKELKVDGGASRDKFLMQFQADICGASIIRPVVRETTAFGAACLAGLTIGFWRDTVDIKARWKNDRVFTPKMDGAYREKLTAGWHKAVSRSRDWAE